MLACACFASGVHAQQAASNSLSGGRDQDWKIYTSLSLFAASDAVPVREFNDDWGSGYQPRSGRNLFFLRNRAEVGVQKNGWSLGREYRQQGFLDASIDAVEFYHLYQQKLRPSNARAFALDAHFRLWSASGWTLAHAFALGSGSAWPALLTIKGAYYSKPNYRDQMLTGKGNYQSNEQYQISANSLESNSGYQYPFMNDLAQSGAGISVSAALAWKLNEATTLNFAIDDLWSRMSVENLPTLQKRLNSDAIRYDADGYVNYQPLLSGQYTQIAKRFSIGSTLLVAASYRTGQWELQPRVRYLDHTYLPDMTIGYHSPWGRFSGSYDSRFNTKGVGYENGAFTLHVRSDRWDLNQAQALGLDLAWHYRF